MAICDQPGVISDQAGSWAKSADDDYKRLQEEAMAELQQLRAGIGMPTGDISIQNPEVTSLFTRIRLFVKGELDVKDLGCLLCCIGPTVDNKLEANPDNRGVYGLGACVCCVAGERTLEEEIAARKLVAEKTQKKVHPSHHLSAPCFPRETIPTHTHPTFDIDISRTPLPQLAERAEREADLNARVEARMKRAEKRCDY